LNFSIKNKTQKPKPQNPKTPKPQRYAFDL
jgi:hypothetical protein